MKKRNTSYYKHNGLELSLGNDKLPDNTLILNMGSASECPSKVLGYCKVICEDTGKSQCYALNPEILRPKVKAYRDRQKAYWMNTSKEEIFNDFHYILTTRKRYKNGKLQALNKSVKYFRFNESGDFWSQDCIDKLDFIAINLKGFGIKTYGYTARYDLNVQDVSFTCKGSGHNQGNNGKCIAKKMSKKDANDNKFKKMVIDGEEYFICPMDCTICGMCKKNNGVNVCIPKH